MAKMGRPKSENAKKKTLSIRVEDALYERICNYAEQHQLTVTEDLCVLWRRTLL